MLDLDALERAAAAATPGPWQNAWKVDTHSEHMIWTLAPGYEGADADIVACTWFDGPRMSMLEADADFVCAANPAAILTLIARLRAAEAEAGRLLAACEEAHAVLYHYDLADQLNGVRWSRPEDLREKTIDTLWAAIEPARAALEARDDAAALVVTNHAFSLEELRGENARLREALETIEAIESGRVTATRMAGDVARAALEPRD